MKLILNYVWKWIIAAATLSSIIGLIITFSSSEKAIIIALAFFCAVLLLILIGVLVALNRLVKQNNNDEYAKISSFFEFRSDDGIKSTFELYRLIQCKCPVLPKIEYKFKWSGSKPPKFTSNSQTIDTPCFSSDPNKWDTTIIHFPRPLTFNETTVVHIRCENDDYDGKAEPFISTRLESPIRIMQFRVLLSYKDDSYIDDAIFERRLINTEANDKWEYIGRVGFDSRYKQYQYVVVDPEPGYYYRLAWNK